MRISVIIPTRERADTLASSLQTVTAQDDADLEIIVSDNLSGDGTHDVVHSFGDSRTRYVNPGQRLAMSQHFEFALSHSTGAYVSFLGDDDGLLPGAITDLRSLIGETGSEAVCWKTAGYYWPRHPVRALRNRLDVPLHSSLKSLPATKILQDVIAFRKNYHTLPSPYWGLVSRELIRKAAGESGRFFNSMTPDVYSGIAIACVAKEFHYSTRPYSVGGASHKSIGAALHPTLGTTPEAQKYHNEENIPFHPRLEYVDSIPILILDSMLQAQDNMKSAKRFEGDVLLTLRTALRQAAVLPGPRYQDVLAAVERIAKANGLSAAMEGSIRATRNRPSVTLIGPLGYDAVRRRVTIDCSAYGVRNILQASQLANSILVLRDQGLFTLGGTLGTTRASMRRYLRMLRANGARWSYGSFRSSR